MFDRFIDRKCQEAEFDMRRQVERYHEATSDDQRMVHRVMLDHHRAIWLHYNARRSPADRKPIEIIYIWDPAKPALPLQRFDDGDDDDAF